MGARRRGGRAGWALAKEVLRAVFERRAGVGARVAVGRVVSIGEGSSRVVYAGSVELTPDPRGESGSYAVALPVAGADGDVSGRSRREELLLARLQSVSFPFRVPSSVGVWPVVGGLALVRRFEPGEPLELRAGRQPRESCEAVAAIAAAVHAQHGAPYADIVPGHDTRREHAMALLCVLDGLREPEAVEAAAWAEAHLPPEQPGALLHGDLLGQNILVAPTDDLVVVDWEYAARGDPAYDLAVVTCGARGPSQVGGLDEILEAYGRHGGSATVTREHVQVHEIARLATYYRASLAGEGVHGPDVALGALRSLVRRLR